MAQGFNLTAQVNLRGPTNVRQVVGNIQRQFQGINANVNVQINPQTVRQVTNAQAAFQNFNRTLNDISTSSRSASQAINQLNQAVGGLSNNLRNIPQNINNINTGLGNVANQTTQASRNTQQLTSEFAEFGRQSALAVRRFAAFATVTGTMYRVSNAISSASKDFIEFEKELVKVAQVTNTSIGGLNNLVKNITSLSTGLGVASKDLIGVSRVLTQAGLSANETSIALQALARSALAPTFDNLNNTVEGSIALMRQFSISAKDLEASLGSINAVAGKFAVEAGDIISAVSRAGGVFAAASKGVSEGKDALNEFIAVFTSVRATTRESAETIATGLRTIFTRIQREDTINALEKYGVALTDLEGKFVGPYEAVKRLAEGLRSIDPRDVRFSRIVEDLGGFRQIGKVIPLIQQFTTAQQALNVAQQGQASLAKDASIAQLSLANQISKVREEFSGLIRSIGQSSGFQDLARLALDLTSGMIALADAAKGALPALTAIFAIKGFSALTQFTGGFLGGIRRGGGRLNKGGPVMAFARGGVVPGTGNRDTVPAMLQPGEFVIRKKAVSAIGTDRLHKMNKYATGGSVADAGKKYNIIGSSYVPERGSYTLSKDSGQKFGTSNNISNKFNARDKIKFTRDNLNIDVNSIYKNKPTDPLYVAYKDARSASKRGLVFEEIVENQYPGKYKESRNPSAYLDGVYEGRVAEIKSNERVSERNLGRKMLAAAISGSKNSPEASDILMGKKLTDIRLRKQPEQVDLGSLLLINDTTKGVNVRKKDGNIEQRDLGRITKSRDFKKKQTKAIGGFIQRFNIGGEAEEAEPLAVAKSGKVNRSAIQSATLSQLQATLKNSSLNIASRNQISNAIKEKEIQNSAPVFGLAGIRGVPFDEFTQTPSKKNVRIIGSTLPSTYGDQYENKMSDDFTNTVRGIGQDLAQGINAQVESADKVKTYLRKTGFFNAVGAYLETAVASIGAPFVKDNVNDPIDFPSGLGAVAAKFGLPSNIPTDVTRTVGDTKDGDLRGKGQSKFLSQVDNYLTKKSVAQTAATGGFIQKLMAGGYGQSKPPSPKQLNFLKSLVDKHGVPEGMEYPPKTSAQASALIDKIKNPPKQGLNLNSLFNEYQQIFGMAHPQAKEAGSFDKEEIKDWAQNIDRTIEKYNKFANVIKEYRGKIIQQDSYNGSFYAFGGPNPRMPKRAELDRFVQGGGFDRKLLEEFGKRGDLAFGSSVNAPRSRSANSSALRTRKTYMRGYAQGGLVHEAISGETEDRFSRVRVARLNKGGAAEDTVPALLTPGEFVINKKAASRIGAAKLHSLNRADKVQGFNSGGPVGHIQKFQNGGSASVSSQNTNFIALASVQQAAQQAAQAQQQSADNLKDAGSKLSNAGLALAFVGPMLADQIGSAVGGIAGAGVQGAVTGVTTAVSIGSQLPGLLGTLVSFGGGLVLAIDGWNKAVAQKEEELASSKIEESVKRTEQALERFGKNAGDIGAQKDIIGEINALQQQEQARAAAIEKQKQPGLLSTAASYASFGYYQPAKQQEPDVLSGELAANQQEAATASQSLIQQYLDHGKTLQETQNFLKDQGTSINDLNTQIIEANPKYQEAIVKIQQSNMAEELKTRQIEATRKKFVDEANAATEAQFADQERARAAAANARALDVLSASMTRTFNNLNQSINLASNSLKLASDEIKNIASGSRDFTANLKTAEVLQNPNVFGRSEQNRAISQASQFAGADRQFVESLARFSLDADNIIASVAATAQKEGANPEVVAKQAIDALTSQLEGALGQNTLTNDIRNTFKASIEKAIKEEGDNADIQKLLEDTLGSTIKQSQQVFEALNNSTKLLQESLNFAATSAVEYAKLQDNIRQQQAFSQNVIVQSNLAVKEALGENVGLGERSAVRRGVAATQAGVGAANFNLADLVGRRNFLQQESENLSRALDNLTQNFDSTTAGVSQRFLALSQKLAETNDALSATERGLQELPKLIEQNINDIVSEIGRIQQEFSSRQQAGAGFAEKLVGSTPQELQNLGNTFNLLNNTLNGNITTIQNSQAAQQAYFQSLQNGQTQQEAMAAAQQAFAGETQSALGLFNELSQLSGLQGPEINAIRADLLENFAKAQGQGVDQNPMFREIIGMLRRAPDQDPQIQALQRMLAAEQQSLMDSTQQLNLSVLDKQSQILNAANDRFIQALQQVELRFDMSQLRDAGLGLSRPGQVVNRSKGGVVYASDGAYVNYEPRGTDTVPAMLTPGEFVVNAQAARKNLPLLRSINSSAGKGKTYSRGGVVYAAGGLDDLVADMMDMSTPSYGGTGIYGEDGYWAWKNNQMVRQGIIPQGTSRDAFMFLNQGASSQWTPGVDRIRALQSQGMVQVPGGPVVSQQYVDDILTRAQYADDWASSIDFTILDPNKVAPKQAPLSNRARIEKMFPTLSRAYNATKDFGSRLYGGIRGLPGRLPNVLDMAADIGSIDVGQSIGRAFDYSGDAIGSAASAASTGFSNFMAAQQEIGGLFSSQRWLGQLSNIGANAPARGAGWMGNAGRFMRFLGPAVGGVSGFMADTNLTNRNRALNTVLGMVTGQGTTMGDVGAQSSIGWALGVDQGSMMDQQLGNWSSFGLGVGSLMAMGLDPVSASLVQAGAMTTQEVAGYIGDRQDLTNSMNRTTRMQNAPRLGLDASLQNVEGQMGSDKYGMLGLTEAQRNQLAVERSGVNRDRASIANLSATERSFIQDLGRKKADIDRLEAMQDRTASQEAQLQQLKLDYAEKRQTMLDERKEGGVFARTEPGFFWNSVTSESESLLQKRIDSEAQEQAKIMKEERKIAQEVNTQQKAKDKEDKQAAERARNEAYERDRNERDAARRNRFKEQGLEIPDDVYATYSGMSDIQVQLAEKDRVAAAAKQQEITDINNARKFSRDRRSSTSDSVNQADEWIKSTRESLPPDIYPEKMKIAEEKMQKLIDEARYLENSSYESDPFSGAQSKLEYEQNRRDQLDKLYTAISNETVSVQLAHDEAERLYSPEQRKQEWERYNKGEKLKQGRKEREQRQAYNRSIDKNAKLAMEAARITGVPMPNKMTNVEAFNRWRDNIIKKIGNKFPLTGDPSKDSQILQQYGLSSDVTKALYQPFSPSEVSAVYGSMLASGGYDTGTGNLVRALQMSNQAIEKGIAQDPKIQNIIASADPKTVKRLNRQFVKTFSKNARQVQGLNNVVQNFANLNEGQKAMARANLLKRLGKQGLADPRYPDESINRLNAFGGQGVASFLFPNKQVQNRAIRVNSRVPARRARGGMIYANNGMLVPYEPRGTDTVPAMLTPGEFVVNRQATQKNLPLLKSINKSKGGRVSYLAEGGSSDPTKYIDGVPVSAAPDPSLDILKNVDKNTISSKKNIGKVEDMHLRSSHESRDRDQFAVNEIAHVQWQADEIRYRHVPDLKFEHKDIRDDIFDLSRTLIRITETILRNTQLLVATQVTAADINAALPAAAGGGPNVRATQALRAAVASFNKGGVVYASNGTLVNYQPKGTDTVPAMLTPGEFVVNAKATSKNLGLLKAINSGYMEDGGVVYASTGGSIDVDQDQLNKAAKRDRIPYQQAYQALQYYGIAYYQNSLIDLMRNEQQNRQGSRSTNQNQQQLSYTNAGIQGQMIDVSNLASIQAVGNDLLQRLLPYASSQGKKKLLASANNNYGIQSVQSNFGNIPGGAAQGTGTAFHQDIDTRNSRIGFKGRVAEIGLVQHEMGHAIQNYFGSSDPNQVAQLFNNNPQVAKIVSSFLTDPKGWPAITQALPNMYSSEVLFKNPNEIFTSLIQTMDFIKSLPAEYNQTKSMYDTTLKTVMMAMGFSKGGPVYANNGMFVPKGSDTVPAMLSPGEFVVNRRATQRNLPALQRMNKGGRVSYLADGGEVGGGINFGELFAQLSNFGQILPSINAGLQSLLQNLQQNTNNPGAGVNNTSVDISGISQFTQAFNGFIQQLSALSIPSTINLQLAPVAPLQVTIMGAEVLANIEPTIREIATGLIKDKLQEFADENFDGVTVP